MSEANIKLAGTVQRLTDRVVANEPQQAQIRLASADFLYDELRVPNIHKWEVGTGIEVTIRPVPASRCIKPRAFGDADDELDV